MNPDVVIPAFISLVILVMLIWLFIWLTAGFFDPGFGMVLFGIGAVFLFFVFGWVFIIATAALAAITVGFLMGSSQ